MLPVRRTLAWLACLGLAGFLLGCNRTSTPPSLSAPAAAPPGPAAAEPFDTESGPFAAGKQVFVASGCFRCHSINGIRGPVGGGASRGGPGGPSMAGGPGGPGAGPPRMGRSRAPDLGKVGQDPAHTVAWFLKYIPDPKAVKPDARMPPFEGKIQENDLRALARYLASLK